MQFEHSDRATQAAGVADFGGARAMPASFPRQMAQTPDSDAATSPLDLITTLDWVETSEDLRQWLPAILAPRLHARSLLVSLGEFDDRCNWRQAAAIDHAFPQDLRAALFGGGTAALGGMIERWRERRTPVMASVRIASTRRGNGDTQHADASERGLTVVRRSASSDWPERRSLESAPNSGTRTHILVHLEGHPGHGQAGQPARPAPEPPGNSWPATTAAYTVQLHAALDPAERRGILLLVAHPENPAVPLELRPRLQELDPVLPRLYCKVAGILLRGRRSTDHPQAPERTSDITTLSAAERQVLAWIAKGKSNWEIAKILGRAENTVRNQVGSILSKLRLGSRAEAAEQYQRYHNSTHDAIVRVHYGNSAIGGENEI